MERKSQCDAEGVTHKTKVVCRECGGEFASPSSLFHHKSKHCKPKNVTESMAEFQTQIEELTAAMKALTAVHQSRPSGEVASGGEVVSGDEVAAATTTDLPRHAAVVKARTVMTTTTVTETESVITFIPWDGPEPSCIVITTAQIVAAFKENTILQEYASLHHDEMTDPKTAPDYVLELFMDLIRRGHESPEARNIYLNPARVDQVLIHLRNGAWEIHTLTSVSRTLLENIARAMKRTTLNDRELRALPMEAQEALAQAGLQYGANPAKFVRAVQKPLAAYLANIAPPRRALGPPLAPTRRALGPPQLDGHI